MRKKIIVSPKTESEILQILNSFGSINRYSFSSRNKIKKSRWNKDKYYVYKTKYDGFLGIKTAMNSYNFVCSIHENNGNRIIEYQVVPSLFSAFLFVLLPAILVYALCYSILHHSVNIAFLSISIVSNILVFVVDRMSKREYTKEFEQLFVTEQQAEYGSVDNTLTILH